MTESFACHFSCVTCYISKSQISDLENLDEISLRTNSNFYEGLENIQSSSEHVKGVYKESELCRLMYCKVPEVIGADIFHDLDEGVTKELIEEAISYLTKCGNITTEEVHSRILGFDYGVLDQDYCPSDMRHLSGLQVRNLALRFNLIFADLITTNNDQLFKLTSHLSTVIQIVYSSKLNQLDLEVLDKQIMELLTTMQIVFPNVTLKWKSHFLTHYTTFVMKLGPLCANETSAYEMKHRFFTRIAEKNTQFLNILWSFAFRHQISWSDLWSRTGDLYEIKYEKAIEIGIDNEIIFQHLDVFSENKKIFLVKSAHCVFTYQTGYYIFKNDQFHEICNVFVQDKIIFLKCVAIKTYFDTVFVAHKIIGKEITSSIFSLETLINKETYTTQTPYSINTKYILCKRNVLKYFE